MKLQESDKIGADSADKLSKVITELDLVSTALNEAENKASLASKVFSLLFTPDEAGH